MKNSKGNEKVVSGSCFVKALFLFIILMVHYCCFKELFSLRRKPSMVIPNKDCGTEMRLLIMMWITPSPTTPTDEWTHHLEHLEWRISSQTESSPWIKSICWLMYPWQVCFNSSLVIILLTKLRMRRICKFWKIVSIWIVEFITQFLHGFSNINRKQWNCQYVSFIYITRWHQIFW